MNRRTMIGCATGSLAIGSMLGASIRPLRAEPPWPSKPLRLIFPFPPGNQSEVFLRTLGQRLHESLGQPLVVDYRPGATGMIGSTAAKIAPPDGYTLLFAANSSLVISPMLLLKPPYDAQRDFTPVTMLLRYPFYLVVNKDLPVSNVGELIALAKARPGKLNVASIGQGSGTHLIAELFKARAGVAITHVPYKNPGTAVLAVSTGEADLYFDSVSSALPFVQAGKVKALAVTGPRRLAVVPDTPTLAEAAGLEGFDATIWWGIVAPLGTPQPIVRRLSDEIQRIVAMPDMRTRMDSQGWEPFGGGPEHFAAYVRAETPQWANLIKELDLKQQ
ncbi:MAG TPA: tripartite tricarboxylate transporter substrate binding protein [Burkholderiaceae bacterium]|nr:tripartite tricarboxylate transporter substrate binding protein [Burkholderiaceae bacterium]